MNSADYVDERIAGFKAEGMPVPDAVWETGLMCIGWPYTFGVRGGKVTKGGITVRTFDCRGFTYWCAKQFGVTIEGAGCTSQWNNEANWAAKGTIGNIPDDRLVCLFYRDKKEPQKMAHTGFGYHGQTVECSSGVQFFEKRKAKWEYWAIPKGFYSEDIPTPAPATGKPTLRKGSKGEYVTLLQTLLINRGYQLPVYGADGSFGNETLAAVKHFQLDHALNMDGIAGPATWAALEDSTEPELYTAHIPTLQRYMAEALVNQYPGAWMTKEGDA